MPLETLIIDDIQLIIANAQGKLTKEEVLELQRTLLFEQKEKYVGYNNIFNCADANFDEFTVSDLSKIVENTRKVEVYSPAVRVAIVVSSDYTRQMAEFYQMAVNNTTEYNRKIKIFDSLQKALDWVSHRETEVA